MRRALLVAALLALAVALTREPPPPDGGPKLRDFEAYYAAGQTWHYRGDPYSRDVWRGERDVPGVVATRDELLPFVGPPFGLPLWSVLGRLSFAQASLLWFALLLVAAAGIVLASVALATGRLPQRATIAAAIFAGAFAPLTGGIALGQVAIVACAAIVALPFALRRPRGIALAAAAALVAGLQPNLAVVLAARLGGARAWIALVTAALFALGASALALGDARGLLRYADVLRAHADAERYIAIQTVPSAVARAFGASPALADTAGWLVAAAALVALARAFASRRFAADARLVLACAVLPLVLPFAHEHDFTLALAPAIVAAMRARRGTWVLGATGALALAVDWLGLVQRPGALASTCALAVAAACALAALAPERLRPYHALPFALVPAVAICGWLAARHPLATWPSALPVDFHVAATLPAAEVWRDEQVRGGIAVLDPVWGALRLIPLVATALVYVAASRALRTGAGQRLPGRVGGG